MKIIVGLGNPGKKYENTRHNVGFLTLDRIVIKLKVESYKVEGFKLEKKFEVRIAKFKLGNEDIVLVKPQTFMNLSGKAVKRVVDFYKINPEKDLIVVYDDVDIPLGSVRMRQEGSSAGHKGLQSIIDELSVDRFMRVRIGISRPPEPIKVEDYVLQKFNNEELKELDKVFERLIKDGMVYLG